MKKTLLLIIPVILLIIAVQPASAFIGTISAPEGITGAEPWASEMSLTWDITQMSGGIWHYEYTFAYGELSQRKGISHFSVAISAVATIDDFWKTEGNANDKTGLEVGFFEDNGSSSNPGLPSEFYALKIDADEIGSDVYFDFYSFKDPVWGNFYIKDGVYGDYNDPVYAYNTDWWDPDPTAPPEDGLLQDATGAPIYKILRPDSTPIPEPSTLLLLGSALGLAGGIRRFRKK